MRNAGHYLVVDIFCRKYFAVKFETFERFYYQLLTKSGKQIIIYKNKGSPLKAGSFLGN